MCQVVAYRRLKIIYNSKTVCRKSGRGRLREVVVYERFQYKALTENIFHVLGRWLLTEGCRRWRFGCTYEALIPPFHVLIKPPPPPNMPSINKSTAGETL